MSIENRSSHTSLSQLLTISTEYFAIQRELNTLLPDFMQEIGVLLSTGNAPFAIDQK